MHAFRLMIIDIVFIVSVCKPDSALFREGGWCETALTSAKIIFEFNEHNIIDRYGTRHANSKLIFRVLDLRRLYRLYQKMVQSETKIFLIYMILVQNICVFGTILKQINCSFSCLLNYIICFCKSRVMFCAARQNPVCATFYTHRRNRHGSFNQKKANL